MLHSSVCHPIYYLFTHLIILKNIYTFGRKTFEFRYTKHNMNNNGNFNNNQPAAQMSYPFPMQNPPRQPTYVEPLYMNQPSQHYPTHMPHYYHPRVPVSFILRPFLS